MRGCGEEAVVDVEVGELALEDAVEPDVSHEDADYHYVGHGPVAGLEGEVLDYFVFGKAFGGEDMDAGEYQP